MGVSEEQGQARQNRRLFGYYFKRWRKWRREAIWASCYYHGKQWDRAEAKSLDDKHRKHLVLNSLFPIVNSLMGLERQYMPEAVIRPVGLGNEYVAEIGQRVVKSVMDEEAHFERIRAFQDECIVGRGYLVVDSGRDANYRSVLKLGYETWQDMFPDPDNTSLSLEPCRSIFRTRWETIETLLADYPDKAKEIKEIPLDQAKMLELDRGEGVFNVEIEGKTLHLDQKQNRVRVLERWYKQRRERVIITNWQTGQTQLLGKWPSEVVALALTQPFDPQRQPFVPETRQIDEVRLLTTCWDVVLYDGPAPLHDRHYPFIALTGFQTVPVACDSEEGRTTTLGLEDTLYGVIKQAIDPQREKNMRRSAMVDLLNRAPGGGWLIPEGTVNEDNWAEQAGQIAPMLRYKPYGNREPREIRTTLMNQAMVAASQMSDIEVQTITGGNEVLRGVTSMNREAASLHAQRREAALSVLAPILNHARFAYNEAVRRIFQCIPKAYDPDTVMELLGDEGGSPEAQQYVQELLENDDTYNYKVTLSEEDYRHSERARTVDVFLRFNEVAAKMGRPDQMVPMEIVMEFVDLPGYVKEKMAFLQAQQQMAGMGMPQNQIDITTGQMPAQGGAVGGNQPAAMPAGPQA